MSDQEWNRICNRAIWTHTLAITALVLGPCAVWALAPEFVAQFTAMLSSTPYGEGIEAALIFAWFVCLIGCFFPPRRILGRGAWAVLGAGLFGLWCWAVANDVLGDADSVASVIWVLLLCICVAGIIFDGPKSWERRYNATPREEARK